LFLDLSHFECVVVAQEMPNVGDNFADDLGYGDLEG
jgi:hypothetical protein